MSLIPVCAYKLPQLDLNIIKPVQKIHRKPPTIIPLKKLQKKIPMTQATHDESVENTRKPNLYDYSTGQTKKGWINYKHTQPPLSHSNLHIYHAPSRIKQTRVNKHRSTWQRGKFSSASYYFLGTRYPSTGLLPNKMHPIYSPFILGHLFSLHFIPVYWSKWLCCSLGLVSHRVFVAK